jgi:hypothetical protein
MFSLAAAAAVVKVLWVLVGSGDDGNSDDTLSANDCIMGSLFNRESCCSIAVVLPIVFESLSAFLVGIDSIVTFCRDGKGVVVRGGLSMEDFSFCPLSNILR